MTVPRLVVAGTASGVGKTTVVVALARALERRGLSVCTFKCGPDYLDPSYHARATGKPSHNLDGWLMGKDAVRATFERASAGADIALIEGVMGLFDGASPTSDSGSSAEIAKWLDAPVLLVVDAAGMARSIAALVMGFARFDPALRVAGVLANRVGSTGHTELLRHALTEPPILGGLHKAPEIAFASRHLGLHSADERVLPEAALDAWAERAARECDLEAILAAARTAPALPAVAPRVASGGQKRCRIGVARDAAFHFYYEDNLERLVQAGAELVSFSPISDRGLPQLDGLYFGGGYPELFASELAENHEFIASVRHFCASGKPVYGECGGLMYLSRAIQTLDGQRHQMVGALPGVARMFDRLQALGYVEVTTAEPSPIGPAGTRFRGHQFRYSTLEYVESEHSLVYEMQRPRSDQIVREGYARDRILGSYVHAHWASNPVVPVAFVAACANRGNDS